MRRLLVLTGMTLALSAAPALGAPVTVQVGQDSHGLPADQFNAANITISPGTKVHWNWDGVDHSVTSGSPPGTPNQQFDSQVQNAPATFDQTFTHPGVYHYFCRIHYSFGMVGTVTVTGTDPKPAAAFTVSNSTPRTGQQVSFDATSSSTSDGDTVQAYAWHFGDGTSQQSTSPKVSHSFKNPGSVRVTLTVTDAGSATSGPASHQLNVKRPPDTPPTARFTFAPHDPLTGQLVRFDASAASDSDGDSIAGYRWKFGDGKTVTATTSRVTHRYSRAGKVTVTLVVVDSRGTASALKSVSLRVLPPPRISQLHLSKTSFCAKKSSKCPHPGTNITFTLSRASQVRLVVEQKGQAVEHRSFSGNAGKNTHSFSGAGLTPGDYTLVVSVPNGNSAHASFTMLAS